MSDPEPRLPQDLPPDLPVSRFEPGRIVFRIHHRDADPIWYGPAPGEPPTNRFDAPAGEYRVLYAALDPEGAFAETFLRDRGRVRTVSLREAAKARITRLTFTRELRLASLHGAGASQMGADGAVSSGPYATSREWGSAIHGHRDRVHGILYRARHDDDLLSVALFLDRTEEAVLVDAPPEPLSRPFLGRMSDRYGFGLIR